MIQYNLTQPFTLIKWIKNIFILQVFGSDGHANNIREVYTVEAVMFCTESNQHGQQFLNACLIRIEKMGDENVPHEKNVLCKEEKIKEDLKNDYSLTDEGDRKKCDFFAVFFLFLILYHF